MMNYSEEALQLAHKVLEWYDFSPKEALPYLYGYGVAITHMRNRAEARGDTQEVSVLDKGLIEIRDAIHYIEVRLAEVAVLEEAYKAGDS